MNIVLVYQFGIANVFTVDNPTCKPKGRNAKLILQGDFKKLEAFCWGAKFAGANVKSMCCFAAGDITNLTWSNELEKQPFFEKFSPVGLVEFDEKQD